MPEHHTAISGTITHVFAHRLVVATRSGAILADLTPHGADQIALRVGDSVTLEGEMKPSELKVFSFTHDGKTVRIAHKKKHEHDHDGADPKVALAAAREYGFEPIGEPRRKPKHFEVLARKGGVLSELHIELDGHLRKTKAAENRKWG